jgi:CubicO group peptidase (beta-lactamase class C family)
MLDQSLPAQRYPITSRRSSATTGGDFSSARLARMRAALQRHVGPGRVPGLVALVHQRGREHVEALGTMAFDSDVPVRRDSIFRLASTTKPITAVGAMILVEECRVRLDDPVTEWLPELSGRRVLRTIGGPLDDTVPAKRPITLRDLLTFRSGYGEVALLESGVGGADLELRFRSPLCPFQTALSEAGLSLSEWPFAGTADEFMKRLGSLPLAHQPGERWLYHTSGEILGVLIARVAGKPLGAFLEERIFEPLGMSDTGFRVPEAKLHRLPACYGTDMVTGKLLVLHEAGGGYAARPSVFESGAGGLVSTVDDLLAFGRMMLVNGGGERILSRPSIELMTMDHLTPEQKAASPFFEHFWDARGWGLGLGIITARNDVADAPGRFGWDGAFGTSWYVDPKEELVGVLMTQRRPDRLALPPVTLDFWTSAYQLIEE